MLLSFMFVMPQVVTAWAPIRNAPAGGKPSFRCVLFYALAEGLEDEETQSSGRRSEESFRCYRGMFTMYRSLSSSFISSRLF